MECPLAKHGMPFSSKLPNSRLFQLNQTFIGVAQGNLCDFHRRSTDSTIEDPFCSLVIDSRISMGEIHHSDHSDGDSSSNPQKHAEKYDTRMALSIMFSHFQVSICVRHLQGAIDPNALLVDFSEVTRHPSTPCLRCGRLSGWNWIWTSVLPAS